MEESKLDFNIDQFDFGLHLNRARKLGLYEVTDREALAATTPKYVSRHEAVRKSKEFAKRTKMTTPKQSASGMPATPELAVSEEEIDEEGT